jgi:2-hydroxycyclohexanecarboxyl-CoA dehydrogenase
MSLQGKVALVTGSAQGIGAAIADALAEAGACVAVADLDAEGAASTAEAIASKRSVAMRGVIMDVTSRPSITAAIDDAERALGPLDVLVNNAGIDVITPFVDSVEESWDRIIAVNLKGMLHCCHEVVPRMIQRGSGAIVNIGSDAARVGSSGEAVYSATKGGVVAFTKTLAREVAKHGIRVNCVCPGPTETALLAEIGDASPKLVEALGRAIPMRRLAQPEDIAPAVVFLAGDGAGYITGQTLSVSGGLTMA